MLQGKNCRGGRCVLGLLIAAVSPLANANAETLVQWNFNASNTSPSTANPNLAGTPTASLLGGVTSPSFNSGSPNDTAIPNVGWQTTTYPAINAPSGTAGVKYSLNTLNLDLDVFSFDWRTSNTSSRYLSLQYTIDGSAWLDAATFTSIGGDEWNSGSFDFSTVSGVDNNQNFAVRMVSIHEPSTTSYIAAEPGRTYATTGTWRWDLVTFNGTYIPPTFNPKNLTWNQASGTWDTNLANQAWLDGANPSAYSQSSGQGDNVTFANPAANSVITIDAGGVTPNSINIANSATLTFTGGGIGGAGGLSKSGTGRLILTSSSTFTSVLSPSNITDGVVETRANNALGGGTVSISNATWNSTTIPHSASNVVNLAGVATFDTTTDLSILNGLTGSGSLNKIGSATLGIGGVSNNTGSVTISAGTLRMDTMAAIGGSLADSTTVTPAITVSSATLQLNSTGTANAKSRLSGNIVLSSATLERLQLTPTLGPDPSNGDSIFTSYSPPVFSGDPSQYVGSILSVNGSSTIRNSETRTSSASDTAGGGGSNNRLFINMPVVVAAGSTLTADAPNGTLSLRSGTPTGTLANTGIEFLGTEVASNPNDSITLKPGASLVFTGLADIRIGTQSGTAPNGKALIGLGTTSQESTFKAHARTYLTEIAGEGYVNSNLIVAGSGQGGLRIEAAMNASYGDTTAASTTGLFGVNTGAGTFGNAFTVLSPGRFAALSGYANSPTQTPDGMPITRGGVLTLAANDASGATGLINNGPENATPIRLGLDNTATSGSLIYQIDPAANSGKFANFSGLVLRKSFAGSVTTQLLGNATFNGGGSVELLGGVLSLNSHSLSVATVNLAGGTLDANGLLRTSSLQFSGGTLDVNGKVILDYTNPGDSPINDIRSRIIGSNGIVSTLASLPENTGLTGIGYGDTQALGAGIFGGESVDGTTVLLRYTALGDANLDGTVDSMDFTRFLSGYGGNSGLWTSGDFNYDSKTDTRDFNLLAGNFGDTVPAPLPGAPLGSVVPEPGCLGVLGTVSLLMASRRRKG